MLANDPSFPEILKTWSRKAKKFKATGNSVSSRGEDGEALK